MTSGLFWIVAVRAAVNVIFEGRSKTTSPCRKYAIEVIRKKHKNEQNLKIFNFLDNFLVKSTKRKNMKFILQ